MKVTGCGSGLSPGSRDEAFPAREGGRRGRGCREQQPSTAGEDTGRMFNQGREGKARKGGRACPDLQPAAPRMGEMAARESGRRLVGSSSSCPALREMLQVRPSLPTRGEEGVRAHDTRAEVVGQPCNFQHSCSVLQRLVLAPLLLPYCFQKH